MLNNIDDQLDSVSLDDGIDGDEAKIIADELVKNDELVEKFTEQCQVDVVKLQS